MNPTTCRFCRAPLSRTFVDLGMAPMVSRYLAAGQLREAERFYPLHAYVCDACFLVQLPEAEAPDAIFGEYPYFSSVSTSWLEHARRYVEGAVGRFGLDASCQVVEIASNDGYLLQYFQQRGIPVQGVEPARNIAAEAQRRGIPTLCKFFGESTARELVGLRKQADLVVGNNVLAHVPDINDFVSGVRILLKEAGRATFEFPHLLRTMAENQFDQVFHEHFSYLSLGVVERVFAAHGLEVFDAEELPTHGGSLRVFARHAGGHPGPVSAALEGVRDKEREFGLERPETYDSFMRQAQETKYKLLNLLIAAKSDGRSIVGYGAPGKGCVLLNYCGIRSDFLDYLVDLSPAKQGLYMPGVHLPILHPERIRETRPDYVLVLPWNLRKEIVEQLSYVREWGGRFIVPIPVAHVVE